MHRICHTVLNYAGVSRTVKFGPNYAYCIFPGNLGFPMSHYSGSFASVTAQRGPDGDLAIIFFCITFQVKCSDDFKCGLFWFFGVVSI